MQIKFLGVGSAFNHKHGQSNMLLTSESGKKMLIDCGSTLWANNQDLNPMDIDALYVTHNHSDHIGGIEELVFRTFFSGKKIKLFCESHTGIFLHEHCLFGGLYSLLDKLKWKEICELFDYSYFTKFEWEGIKFTQVKSLHVDANEEKYKMYNYGLFIEYKNHKIYISGDTCTINEKTIKESTITFHDCETSFVKTGVHARFEDLICLPKDLLDKTFFYHYNANIEEECNKFVNKGQIFEF